MYSYIDEDEWETVVSMTEHGGSIGQRRRPAEEVKRIKAERLRTEEDEILRRVDEIRASRALAHIRSFGYVL